MLKESIKHKADKVELDGLRKYIDQQDDSNFQKLAKDFISLESRVTALEKRITQLTTEISGIKMPEQVVSSPKNFDASDILQRLSQVERGLSDLRD